jgi:hypothetical protein
VGDYIGGNVYDLGKYLTESFCGRVLVSMFKYPSSCSRRLYTSTVFLVVCSHSASTASVCLIRRFLDCCSITSRSQRISAGPMSEYASVWRNFTGMVKDGSDWRLCVPGLQEFGYFIDRLIQHGLVAMIVGQQRHEVGHVVVVFRCVSFIK